MTIPASYPLVNSFQILYPHDRLDRPLLVALGAGGARAWLATVGASYDRVARFLVAIVESSTSATSSSAFLLRVILEVTSKECF